VNGNREAVPPVGYCAYHHFGLGPALCSFKKKRETHTKALSFHSNRPRLRNLSVLQAVMDVRCLPPGILPVLGVLGKGNGQPF